VVAGSRLNAKREDLMGRGMIESGAYSYPSKSIRRPDPIFSLDLLRDRPPEDVKL